ncbi:MAG: formate dehydrogenase subunit gamma [Pseudomonadota bacterium]
MNASIRQLLAAAALCLATGASLAQATAPAPAAAATPAEPVPKGPPAGFVVPADPKPGESNAERMRSQPGNNAPMWRAVRDSGLQPGSSNLPGAEMGVLIQPFVQYPGSRLTNAGEAWRQVRNQWLLPYGGSLLLIVVIALGLFYWRKGALGHDHPDTGLIIERFTPLERAAHWTNAIAFVTLAISGIVMAFGKFFLLPVLGGTLFGWITYALKTAHNFAGPLFAVSLLIVFITFVKDNLPSRADVAWLLKAGGMFGGEEVPSHRFNAGEKVVFWGGVLLLGLVVVVSGLVLDKLVPGLAYLRGDMQVAHMVHAVAALLMMALFAGHIYMGTIGMKGAYRAMRQGYVSEGWAHEHHALWLDDVKAGKIPAQRSTSVGAPAAVAGTAPQV